MKIVVLLSGNGSNCQALIDNAKNYEVTAVISDKDKAYGLVRAGKAGIATTVLSKIPEETRENYDERLAKLIQKYAPDLVVLAGFMRILTPGFIAQFPNQIVNIHPSLLPDYKGRHTHQRVLNDGQAKHGASIHLVTAELDGGPLIAQASLDVLPDETASQLQQRVHALEHQLYPSVIAQIAAQNIRLTHGVPTFHDQPIGQIPLKLNQLT